MKSFVHVVLCLLLIPIFFVGIFNIGELVTPTEVVTSQIYLDASSGDPAQVELTYQKNGKYVTVKPSSYTNDVKGIYSFVFRIPEKNDGLFTLNFGAANKAVKTSGIAFSTLFRTRGIGAVEMAQWFTKTENVSNMSVNTATALLNVDSEEGEAKISNTDPIKEFATPVKKLLIPGAAAIVLALIASSLITEFLSVKFGLKNKKKVKKVDGEAVIEYEDEKKEDAPKKVAPSSYVGLALAAVAVIGIFFGGFPKLVMDAATLVREASKTEDTEETKTLSLKEQLAAAQAEKEAAAKAEREAQGIEEAVEKAKEYDDSRVYPIMTDSGEDYEDYNRPKISEVDLVTDGFTQDNVHVGKTDDRGVTWYFYNDEHDEFEGSNLKSDRELSRMANKLTKLANGLAEKGIKFYILVGPNKSDIYPEYTPATWYQSSYTLFDQVLDYLHDKTDLTIVDCRQDLIAAKTAFIDEDATAATGTTQYFPLYYEYDTHWNNYGGSVAYAALMKVMAADFPAIRVRTLDDYQINIMESYMKDQLWYIGYYNKLESMGPQVTPKVPSGTVLVDIAPISSGGIFAHQTVYPDGFVDWNSFSKFYNQNLTDAGAPVVYVARDSFAISLTYYLKDSFASTVFSMTHGALPTIADAVNQGATAVVYEVAERNLGELFH